MAATLIVGMGGMGQKVVRLISDMIDAENLSEVELVVMDTDVNDLRETRDKYPRIYTVQTSPRGTVGAALDQNHYARNLWFPVNDGLTGKPFTEGAGQVRAVSRLAFDHAIEQGYMSELEKAIEKLHGLSGETLRQEMRIMIVGSNNGGTGSGLVLPVAMYIRNFLMTRYQDNSAIIRGFFLEPDTIFDRIVDEEERNSLRSNAYATIREIDAFFRKEYSGESDEFKHVVFNAPQPGSGERVDYPNILPYQYVFLMDAINSEGEHLPNHEAYLQHAAEIIYAQALSAVSARSSSSEDNVIRKLAASSGRSRYCGAGASYLEYPVKEVQRYIGLRWAADNISHEWMEIDQNYERLRRDDDELTIEDHYTESFRAQMETVPFYRKIGKRVYREYDIEGGRREREWPADEFPDAVMDHATQVISRDLGRQCSEMQHSEVSLEQHRIPATSEAIQAIVDENDDATTVIKMQFDNYYETAKRYNSSIEGEVATAAARMANTAYSISEYNTNPLLSNVAPWQVESLMRVDDGSGVGCVHPGAVRFMLYRASIRLAEEIEDCESAVLSAKNQIDSFIASQERRAEADASLIDGDSPKKKKKGLDFSLPSFGRGSTLDEGTMSLLEGQAKNLARFKKNIDKRREHTVKKAFLTAAKQYVDTLSGAYKGFYDYLGQQIDKLSYDADNIESDPRFANDVEGQTHKYICASERCLKGMLEECPVKGDTSELPAELCARIYNSLLSYVKFASDARSSEAKNQAFKGFFEETIVDYWIERVMDPVDGWPLVIDKTIPQAIAAEAIYLHDGMFSNKEEEAAYVNGYMRSVFDKVFHLAAPFIEPPVGEMPRTFKTCAYSEAILEGNGAYSKTLEQKLSEYNGTVLPASKYSKYSIMFYRSLYGFCATNLPKYAPAHGGLQPMPEGEYHRVYYALVNQLSPNLKENTLITPHIDKSWHLVEALPELNSDFEKQVRERIVRAWIFGLIYQQFGAEPISTGDDIYYLTSTSTQKRTDLWVSNGTPCDRFYEVYDAMKYNPRAVLMLVNRSENELLREQNASNSSLSIENCRLLHNMRSHAFTNDDAIATSAIVEAIRALRKEGQPDRTMVRNLRFDTDLVIDFFNKGAEYSEDVEKASKRRSVLEIPVYYRISLPQSETRVGEMETLIESIFSVVKRHLSNFASDLNLEDQAGRFFEEQYMLFERNLVDIERMFPGIANNNVVNTIREKTVSFMEPIDSRFERVKTAKVTIEATWRETR